MQLIRRLILISVLFSPLLMISQSDSSDNNRGYDQVEIERLNTSKSFDYSRDIPPPKNYLIDFINGIARAIIWLFSNIIGYVIVIGLVALLIWIILKNTTFGRSAPRDKKDIDPLIQIRSGEQLANEDFDALIQNALAVGDFRAAIRYSFLKALKVLQVAKQIDWQIEKTNYDYLWEMPEQQQGDFRSVLRVYEYVWYGEFDASERAFNHLSAGVESIKKRANE